VSAVATFVDAAPAASSSLAPAPQLQRKCACGGAPGVDGMCDACRAKKLSGGSAPTETRGADRAQALQMHRFETIDVHDRGVQTKLTVGPPDDRYEQEAERVADEVVRRSEGSATAGPRELASGAPPILQRQGAGETERVSGELEAENAEEPEEPESAEENEDSGQVQTFRSSAGRAPRIDSSFETRLARARSGGEPLPEGLRTAMERSFGASFGDVRVHADGEAADLSLSIGASAFTHGTHIYFGAHRADYTGNLGRRLLAHELTHVVQQNPALAAPTTDRFETAEAEADARLVNPAPPVALVQRDDDKAPPDKPPPPPGKTPSRLVFVGLYDANGDELVTLPYNNTSFVVLGPGVYPATMHGDTISIPGQKKEHFTYAGPSPALFKQKLSKAKSATVSITDATGKIRGAKGPTAGGRKQGDPGSKPGQPSSKYGWLGLFNLPQPVIDALEKILETLGDAEEMLAVRDLLKALAELNANRSELKSLFTSEKLLGVLFGVEGGAAIDAIENWANKPVKKAPPASGAKHKGIVALALKLEKVIGVLRRILKPVFRIRKSFALVVAGFAAILEEIPMVERLLAASKEERLNAEFDRIVTDVVGDVAAKVRESLQLTRKGLELASASLAEKDYVSYEELARAVLRAATQAVPKLYKPLVWAASKLGLDDAIADKIIAPMIPKAALDEVNGAIREVLAGLEPLIKAVTGAMDEVLAGIEVEVNDTLEPQLKAIFAQTSSLDGSARGGFVAAAHVTPEMVASTGVPLPGDVGDALGAELGIDLADVRIHTDAPAARAADGLDAKAFTIGRDVYFGAAQFAPRSREGRALLAHELTHVVQQAEGAAPTDVVQPTAKTVKKKVGAQAVAVVTKAARSLLHPSPEVQKKGAEITKRVEKLIGRQVVSTTNPALPAEAYSYISNKAGVLVNIRRKVKYVRVVPKLAISKGRIAKSLFSKLNPNQLWKKAERAKLARALACSAGQQAHHVLPLELRGLLGVGGHKVVSTAIQQGFAFNGVENGVCLGPDVHFGPHPRYTARVQNSLDRYLGRSPAEQLDGARAVAKYQQGRLRTRSERLD
jgi:hypothetical protein